MRYVVTISLLLVAIIHLLPSVGALGSSRLTALYGLDFSEPSLSILMRHRAVLFGLLGAFLLYAAFRPALQTLALTAALISVVSFMWLTLATAGHNAHIARVFAADKVALLALVIGGAAQFYVKVRT
jgi:hypothetical protein